MLPRLLARAAVPAASIATLVVIVGAGVKF
jgi:hypothetical protein